MNNRPVTLAHAHLAGQGSTCSTDINECSPNPCQNGGACTDQINGYTCTCASGWTGDTCTTSTGREYFEICFGTLNCLLKSKYVIFMMYCFIYPLKWQYIANMKNAFLAFVVSVCPHCRIKFPLTFT